ncbi:hypothetical protein Tco_0595271 [Tanacetum coccineum]
MTNPSLSQSPTQPHLHKPPIHLGNPTTSHSSRVLTKSMDMIIRIGLQGNSMAGICSKKHKEGFSKVILTKKAQEGRRQRLKTKSKT